MISEYTYATGRLGNEAFLGTLQELADIAKDTEGVFSRYMEAVPADRYWVYRSPDCFGTNSYGRRNTCFWVFLETRPGSREEAEETLETLGLRDLIDELRGSVVLIAPLREVWIQRDADVFARLQRISLDCMLDYFGSFSANYLVGIGTGSDFIHDFVTSSPEISCMVAGAVAIGGKYHEDRARLTSADFVIQTQAFPVYLYDVNTETVRAYQSLHGMEDNTSFDVGDGAVNTSSSNPLIQIVVDREGGTVSARIKKAWDTFLSKRMCIPVGPGRNSLMDSTYWALGRRWDITELGLIQATHENGVQLPDTEFRRWYAWFPAEAFREEGRKYPLILLLHGHCDDPRALSEQCGFIELAGKERLVVCTPEHQYIKDLTMDDLEDPDNKTRQMGRFVDWMLRKYTMLDPERVYVTGFSRGSLNTCMLSFFETEKFAAAAPLSGLGLFGVGESSSETVSIDNWKQEMQKEGKTVTPGLPAYVLVCGRDSIFAERNGLRAHLKLESLGGSYGGGASDALNIYRIMNGLPEVRAEEYDFSRYPFWGFKTDEIPAVETPDILMRRSQLIGKDGHPVIRFVVPEGLDHSLYYSYAADMWDFCRHYKRDKETQEIVWLR
ncbi:MAG: hypothetical protein IJI78_08315 [Oscillospiraceae bacterium]|nr:hypothetical protein [Oscillospiraceae bacterium]